MTQALDKLDDKAIQSALDERADWDEISGVIRRTYAFDDFVQAMVFVNRIADEAERVQHHPDILIRYNKVTLSLSTHDANGITMKDFAFADAADKLNEFESAN
ncbi:MAG: 4a-hydroxytetrahydrobiopterin dehydratase [Phycisphaeraceae bacterium]|nr:4a-hydroxytetrahydrobiopterin dehydratase [Phycisphaeraceae bacterium]